MERHNEIEINTYLQRCVFSSLHSDWNINEESEAEMAKLRNKKGCEGERVEEQGVFGPESTTLHIKAERGG